MCNYFSNVKNVTFFLYGVLLLEILVVVIIHCGCFIDQAWLMHKTGLYTHHFFSKDYRLPRMPKAKESAISPPHPNKHTKADHLRA